MTVPDTGPPVAPDDRRGLWARLRPRMGERPAQPRQPPWRVEGAEGQEPGRPDQVAGAGRSGWSRFWWLLLVLLAVNWVVSSVLLSPQSRATVSYTFFLDQVQAKNVATITSTGEMIQGELKKAVVVHAWQGGKAEQVDRFTTQRPTFANDNLFQQLQSTGVPVNANPPDAGPPLWQQLLLGFGPTLLLVWLFFSFARRGGRRSAGGVLGSFGRSRATLYRPEAGPRTTFADVAGIDEVKGEVTEIVDFLRDPEKYRRLGAQIPRGVLLSGPPGSGKTLLARAVAGEAKVPFFSISASEFIEAIVGVGASRVRDLFEQAKKVAPAIIFIDELDSIGRTRGGAQSLGGNDEREQTLNQILTEMDGFTGNEGVVVLAATNRPEILDPALLRPGRFDRRVTVSPPDLSRTPSDPGRPHPRRPARTRRRPGRRRRVHARHGRRRPGQPRQRGGSRSPPAAATTGWTRPTSPTPWRRSFSAPRGASCSPRRNASGPPTTSPVTRCSACSHPARIRSARCRSFPAAGRWA